MASAERAGPASVARAYLGLQAVGGLAWWVTVFASDDVRRWTLGRWDPLVLVGPDLVLFVGASALAALLGSRVAAAVAAAWTTSVTLALVSYGLVQRAAGGGVVLTAEEADLAARFGQPYQRYAERVRCWIPTRPWRGA